MAEIQNDKKFAVLIDADNISDRYIKLVLEEVSNDGIATYKRIYGDWTKPSLNGWKDILLENSLIPVQQYAYTTGKNSTDSAMIIDAMDILYSGNVSGFCLVSSDSDFTRLASRLRESGMYVVGMGEQKTPTAFISACNRFKYLDLIAREREAENAAQGSENTGEPTSIELIKTVVANFVSERSGEDDWAFIGDVGNMLNKRFPDFDVRNYGFKKLTPFISSLGSFEIRPVRTSHSGNKIIYIRNKQ